MSGVAAASSRAMATLAAYIGGLCKHLFWHPASVGVLLCIAPDQRQASITLDYATAAFEASPMLIATDSEPNLPMRSNSQTAWVHRSARRVFPPLAQPDLYCSDRGRSGVLV